MSFNNNNNSITNNTTNNNGKKNNNIVNQNFEKPEKLAYRVKLLDFIKEKIDKNKIFICLDIEAYERNHNYLTEFGWCLFKMNGEIIKEEHAIVRENINYRNGRYVPDNRYHYLFGDSKVEKLSIILRELKIDLNRANYMVGHGINNDINFLNKIGLYVSKFKKLNYNSKYNDYGLIETMDLFSGFFLCKPIGLEKTLLKIGIKPARLHNAGNDAHFTMKLFLKIMFNFNSEDPKYEPYLNWVFTNNDKSNNNKNKTNNSDNNNNNRNDINNN